jgi:hypothetical protein
MDAPAASSMSSDSISASRSRAPSLPRMPP